MDQFIGFVFFLVMAIAGFWCILFLSGMVGYWLMYGAPENLGKINKDSDPEEVRFKKLYEQKDVEVLYVRNEKEASHH